MTDNEIIKALKCLHKRILQSKCAEEITETEIMGLVNALDLINRQKAEIERLNKNCEELIYKIEYLLCHATGNKFSKYTYTIQEMLSFVDDYIQDCCDEAIEETKANVKSEAIKEFAEKLKENYCFTDRWGKIIPISTVENLVKEMTEVQK